MLGVGNSRCERSGPRGIILLTKELCHHGFGGAVRPRSPLGDLSEAVRSHTPFHGMNNLYRYHQLRSIYEDF
jgi:hypothetical protein